MSDDSGEDEAAQHAAALAAEDEEDLLEKETSNEKRVRLAKEMLDAMDEAARSRREARGDDEGGEDEVLAELEQEALRRSGVWRGELAAGLRGTSIDATGIRVMRGIKLSPTSVTLAADEGSAWCGNKDGSITRWDLGSGARTKIASARGSSSEQGHKSDVLSVALSHDGRTLATGGKDHALLLWDVRTLKLVKTFTGHRGAIGALAVRRDGSGGAGGGEGSQLFSGSGDNCAKLWDMEQMGYVETLFGHQEAITAMDCIAENRLITTGEDRTIRYWKVDEEAQLIFKGHKGPIDCVAQLNTDGFVSGSQDGSLALWHTKRKKPHTYVKDAHGLAPWGGPCWLSSLSSIPFSDVAISGSCDGLLRFWHASDQTRSVKQVASVPMVGFVNGLAVATSGRFLVAAVGQEHRLGRWFRIPEARNSLCVVPLPSVLHQKAKLLDRGGARRKDGLDNGGDRLEGEEDEDEDDEDE